MRRGTPRPTDAGATPPRLLFLPAALGFGLLALPLVGMLAALDWSRFGSLLVSPSSLTALGLSLRTAAASTVLCLLLGVPLAVVLARTRFPGRAFVRGLVLLPLVLPPVVGGIALLYTFGRRGLVGAHLEALGVSIAFSTVAVVLAQTFVALPFLVLSVEGSLRSAAKGYEAIAATLGARPGTVFRRVTLPLVVPGLVGGAVLAFARALGEFGATLTFAGSLEGVTRTLPLEIYLQREIDPDAAVALSVLLIVVAVVIVLAVYSRGERRGSPAPPQDVPSDAPTGAPAVSSVPNVAAPPVSIRARVRDRGVELDVEVAPGEVVAVLGPNGAGKSTLLGLVSGMVAPDCGRIAVGDRVLTDVDAGTLRPPHRRGAATLTQRPMLFPHLGVLANVAFGPRSRGMPRAEAAAVARERLAAVGADGLADRSPDHLSGGQAQRVALARALAAAPEVLLLDEPLAALDVEVAAALRTVLREACRRSGRTTILVTHDLLDVLALADRVLVLEAGRIVEDGPARAVLAAPRSGFAAQLAGVNLVTGVIRSSGRLATPGGGIVHGRGGPAGGEQAVAVFAPSAVALYLQVPHGSPRNVWPAIVIDVQAKSLGEAGVRVRVRAEGIGLIAADLTAAAVADLGLAPGVRVVLAVKATEVDLNPA